MHDPDQIAKESRQTASAVVPGHYQLTGLKDIKAKYPDYYMTGATNDPCHTCPTPLNLLKAQTPNGVYVGGKKKTETTQMGDNSQQVNPPPQHSGNADHPDPAVQLRRRRIKPIDFNQAQMLLNALAQIKGDYRPNPK